MDMNKIKNKLDSLTKKAQPKQLSATDQIRVKLESPGTHTLRLIPYKQNPDYPFVELKIYYQFTKDGKKQQILSPTSYGQKDPIYEKAMILKSTRITEDWEMSKKISPKLRIFALAVVRGQEQKGPRWWDFGPTVYQDILTFINDPQNGDITDPYEGIDIIVDKISKEAAKNSFGDTKVRLKRTSTPLSKKQSQITDWLENQPDIYSCYKKYSYEELEQIWQEYQAATQSPKQQEVSDQQSADEASTLSVMDKFRREMERKK